VTTLLYQAPKSSARVTDMPSCVSFFTSLPPPAALGAWGAFGAFGSLGALPSFLIAIAASLSSSGGVPGVAMLRSL
jgi:hypothetical protein